MVSCQWSTLWVEKCVVASDNWAMEIRDHLVVGKTRDALGPAECHRRALRLWQQMDRLNPNRRPRGFVFKAPTRALYEEWRKAQLNPRLW